MNNRRPRSMQQFFAVMKSFMQIVAENSMSRSQTRHEDTVTTIDINIHNNKANDDNNIVLLVCTCIYIYIYIYI